MDTRDIVREALFCNAAGVVVAHNHPSGQLTASAQDIEVTKALENALNPVMVKLHDHIIVGGDKAVSLSDIGCLQAQSINVKASKVAFSEKHKEYSSGGRKPSIKEQLASCKAHRLSETKTPPTQNRHDRGCR